MTGWVFVFACLVPRCPDPVLPGDGGYYASKIECRQTARQYALAHAIALGRYEITCVERPIPGK